VQAQDYPRVEHIVQDGGSRDGTLEILRAYGGQIDWVSEPDEGQADGLNRALQRCGGELIIVLNADDELLPDAVSWGVENMAKNPDAAVVYGDQYIIDDEGEIVDLDPGPDPYDFIKVLCVESIIPAQAAFIRRSCWEKVGLYADTALATCPDYEMWVRIGRHFPMVHIPGFITRYRAHQGSRGRDKGAIIEMHDTKRSVMDRLFDESVLPQDIRALKKRAHAGAKSWTASILYHENDTFTGLRYACEAFLLYPGKIQGKFLSIYLLRVIFPPGYKWLHRRLMIKYEIVAAGKKGGGCSC
jgi:glycosyltransferase involved in cell wall biosynthesis